MATVEVRFSALPTHVRTARLIASAVARRCGVDDALLDEVRLAVGEACARAVGLHQQHAPAAPVEMWISDDDARFTVTVLDRGPWRAEVAAGDDDGLVGAGELVDPDRLGAPAVAAPSEPSEPIGELLPTGFGLAVIAGLVDDVEVQARNGRTGTAVRMSWPLFRRPDAPSG